MVKQVRVLPGAEGIKSTYAQVLEAERADIVCLSQDYAQAIGDYFEKQFAPKLYGKVKTREILPDKAGNREYAKSKDARVNQFRFTDMNTTETDLIVTETAVILISFKPESAMAIVIEEPEIVKFMRNVYEGLWQGASE